MKRYTSEIPWTWVMAFLLISGFILKQVVGYLFTYFSPPMYSLVLPVIPQILPTDEALHRKNVVDLQKGFSLYTGYVSRTTWGKVFAVNPSDVSCLSQDWICS